MSIDAREFRDALSCFGTGVTIVTAVDSTGAPVGMTASSFNSVSVEPPLILWSVTKAALSADAFRMASHFAVHVLGAHQVQLSNQFARSGGDKFDGVNYRVNAHGVPLLDDFSVLFQCETWAVYEGGDHWIIVGEVKEFHREKIPSLLFSEGAYASATPLGSTQEEAAELAEVGRDPIENTLIYHLSRANTLLVSEFHRAISAQDLTLPEWRVLTALNAVDGAQDIEALHLRTSLHPNALRDLVYTMQDQGLCHRALRGQKIFARRTEKGAEIVRKLMRVAARYEAEALRGVSQSEAESLRNLLRQVIENTSQ
ncbi:flavin oxidoreductase [Amylibacter marinus]|uniref:Flavin oxidoreductase n=1 Tax=Amylibacter marinus TaxID=1475483 RepID=A0ABQ5VS04_9RHOB|nr:flavin reductase [Amylibacter marinus]GLQ33966.1 flavin oxidoreductase [Amylibacter marinus]